MGASQDATSPRLVAAQWAEWIAGAERPSTLFCRDGERLRRVHGPLKLEGSSAVSPALACAFEQSSATLSEAAATFKECKARGCRPSRGQLAWARSVAYLAAGQPTQALKDAQAALAYAPPPSTPASPASQLPKPNPAASTAADSAPGPGTLRSHGRAAAHTACASAHEAAGELALAAVHFKLASDEYQAAGSTPSRGSCTPSVGGGGCVACPQELAGRLSQLAGQLSREQRAALEVGGAAGLSRALEEEAEGRLPDFMRKREKYHYYNQWTRQRLEAALAPLGLALPAAPHGTPAALTAAPTTPLPPPLALPASSPLSDGESAPVSALVVGQRGADEEGERWRREARAAGGATVPEAVVQKLLKLDANDLDLMLQHPSAVRGQALEYLDVLARHGVDALAAYVAEPLSWQEMQALAGPDVVGLPIGYEAPTERLLLRGPSRELQLMQSTAREVMALLLPAATALSHKAEQLRLLPAPPEGHEDDLSCVVAVVQHVKEQASGGGAHREGVAAAAVTRRGLLLSHATQKPYPSGPPAGSAAQVGAGSLQPEGGLPSGGSSVAGAAAGQHGRCSPPPTLAKAASATLQDDQDSTTATPDVVSVDFYALD